MPYLALIISIMVATTSSVYAVPATLSANCGLVTPSDTSVSDLFYPTGNTDSVMSSNVGLVSRVNARFCVYPSLPTIAQLDTNCVTKGETDNQTNYVLMVSPSSTEYCLYQYDINTANAADVRTNAAVALFSMPVPVFTPLGLFVTMFGLMWFGKRRRKK